MERRNAPMDGEDLVIKQHQILENLAQAIPSGRRNQTLYAIGCDMFKFDVPDWQLQLLNRGEQLKLPESEINGIINHIQHYS